MTTRDSAQCGGRAVVLGASVSGILAARVLADFYDQVTVVERDELPAAAAPRKGVPQARHLHALLPGGSRIMEELFPGLLDELVAKKVPRIDDFRHVLFTPGGNALYHRPGVYPLGWYQPSRPCLEHTLADRLRALPNVEVIDGTDVVGLATTAGHAAVAGVRTQRRAAGSAAETLDADLVVDASGRSGRTTAWLAELGYPAPAEDQLAVDIKYASRTLRLQPNTLGEQRIILLGAEPGRPRGIGLVEVEDGNWVLTLFGYGGDHHPPTDPQGFLDFAESVAPAYLFDAIKAAEPLTDVAVHRFPASLRRRYERLERFPDGLVVVGDAVCSFNPLYGQGMSVAALQAKTLQACLADGPSDLGRRFFRAATKPIDVAWDMAVGGDLALPEVSGPRSAAVRLTNAYITRLLRAAEDDIVITTQFLMVCHMVAGPQSLLHPKIVGRVIRGNLRKRANSE